MIPPSPSSSPSVSPDSCLGISTLMEVAEIAPAKLASPRPPLLRNASEPVMAASSDVAALNKAELSSLQRRSSVPHLSSHYATVGLHISLKVAEKAVEYSGAYERTLLEKKIYFDDNHPQSRKAYEARGEIHPADRIPWWEQSSPVRSEPANPAPVVPQEKEVPEKGVLKRLKDFFWGLFS